VTRKPTQPCEVKHAWQHLGPEPPTSARTVAWRAGAATARAYPPTGPGLAHGSLMVVLLVVDEVVVVETLSDVDKVVLVAVAVVVE